MSGVIGFLAGSLAAMKRTSWFDSFIVWYCYTLAATPAFWLGLVLMVVFSVWLGWFPVGIGVPAGVLAEQVTWLDKLEHLVLPAITLSIVGIAPIALHTRQKLIEVLSSDYVLLPEHGEKHPCRSAGGTVCAISLFPRSPCSLPRSVNCSAARGAC